MVAYPNMETNWCRITRTAPKPLRSRSHFGLEGWGSEGGGAEGGGAEGGGLRGGLALQGESCNAGCGSDAGLGVFIFFDLLVVGGHMDGGTFRPSVYEHGKRPR